MNFKELLARAQSIKQKNATRCEVPGSGFHEDDPARKFAAKRGEPPISDHLVSFSDRFNFYYLADDAAKAAAAVKKYQADNEASLDEFTDADMRKQVTVARHVTSSVEDGVPVLKVDARQHNDFLRALTACGLGVTIA